jgi:hypothetical protein
MHKRSHRKFFSCQAFIFLKIPTKGPTTKEHVLLLQPTPQVVGTVRCYWSAGGLPYTSMVWFGMVPYSQTWRSTNWCTPYRTTELRRTRTDLVAATV